MCLMCLFLFVCFRREADLLKVGETFSVTERCSSNDSIKASSGEVSPYDNNSPVLSDGLLYKYPADSDPFSEVMPVFSTQHKHTDRSKVGSGRTSPSLSTDKGEDAGLYHIQLHTLHYT